MIRYHPACHACISCWKYPEGMTFDPQNICPPEIVHSVNRQIGQLPLRTNAPSDNLHINNYRCLLQNDVVTNRA